LVAVGFETFGLLFVASLGLIILCLIFCFKRVPLFGWIVGSVAVVFGVLQVGNFASLLSNYLSMSSAIIGLICSVPVIVVGLVCVLVNVVSFVRRV
jgi:hypothetical protein